MYALFQAASQTTAYLPFGTATTTATSDSPPTNESPKPINEPMAPINEPYEPPESPKPVRRDSQTAHAAPSHLAMRIADLELDLEEAQTRLKDEVRVWKDLYLGLVASNDAEKASKKATAASSSSDTDEEFSLLKSQFVTAVAHALESSPETEDQRVVRNAWLQAEIGILATDAAMASDSIFAMDYQTDVERAWLQAEIGIIASDAAIASAANIEKQSQADVMNAWLQGQLGVVTSDAAMTSTNYISIQSKTAAEYDFLQSELKKVAVKVSETIVETEDQQIVTNAWLQAEIGILATKAAMVSTTTIATNCQADVERAWLQGEIDILASHAALVSATNINNQSQIDAEKAWLQAEVGILAANATMAPTTNTAIQPYASAENAYLKSQIKKAGTRPLHSTADVDEQQVVENAWLQAEIGILASNATMPPTKITAIQPYASAENAYLKSQIKKAGTRPLHSIAIVDEQQVVENAWLQAELGILAANGSKAANTITSGKMDSQSDVVIAWLQAEIGILAANAGMAATKNAFANSQMDFDGAWRQANMHTSSTNAYNRLAESLEMDFQARLNDARQAHKTEIQTLEKTIVSCWNKLKTTQDQLERANSRIDELEDGAGMPTSEELDEANKRIKYLTEKVRRQAESLRNATTIENENEELKSEASYLKKKLENMTTRCRKQEAAIEDLENEVSEMYSSRPRRRVPPSPGPTSRIQTEITSRGNDNDIIDFTDRANDIIDFSIRGDDISENGIRVNGIRVNDNNDNGIRGNGFGDTIRRQPTMSRRRRPSENDYVSPPQSQYDMNALSDYRNPDPNMQSSAISASVPTNSSIMPIYEESRPGADRFKRSIQGNYNPRTRRMQRDFSNTRPEE